MRSVSLFSDEDWFPEMYICIVKTANRLSVIPFYILIRQEIPRTPSARCQQIPAKNPHLPLYMVWPALLPLLQERPKRSWVKGWPKAEIPARGYPDSAVSTASAAQRPQISERYRTRRCALAFCGVPKAPSPSPPLNAESVNLNRGGIDCRSACARDLSLGNNLGVFTRSSALENCDTCELKSASFDVGFDYPV